MATLAEEIRLGADVRIWTPASHEPVVYSNPVNFYPCPEWAIIVLPDGRRRYFREDGTLVCDVVPIV